MLGDDMGKKITLLGFDNTYSTSFFGVVDLFEAANMIARSWWGVEGNLFDWQAVSITGEPIKFYNGLSSTVSGKLELPKPNRPDNPLFKEVIVLLTPFIYTMDDLDKPDGNLQRCVDWIKNNHQHYDQIVTHCQGTFFLAEAGLLDGLQATTSWWMARKFTKRYPNVELIADKRMLSVDRFLLGGSTSCYRDIGISLVEEHSSSDIARMLSKFFLMDRNQNNQSLYTVEFPFRSKNPVVNRAQHWITKNLDKSISISEVADQAAVTTRTLSRHFQKDFGYSPQVHIQKLRVEKSKALLETTRLNLGEIASRCGYSDESAFRRVFKKYCDVSPNEFRKMFSEA